MPGVDQNVEVLEVAVDDAAVVDVLDAECDLLEKLASFIFGEMFNTL